MSKHKRRKVILVSVSQRGVVKERQSYHAALAGRATAETSNKWQIKYQTERKKADAFLIYILSNFTFV